MRHSILTPGMKKRILAQLKTVTAMVKRDEHRNTITYRLAELMPWIANEFSYYDPIPKKTRTPRRDHAHAVDLGDEGR